MDNTDTTQTGSENVDDASANNAGTNDTSDNAQTSQDGAQGGENTSTSDDNTRTYTAEEVERIKARMQAADRRASELEKKVQKFENANKSELEKLQDEAKRAAAERDATVSELRNLRLQNAFLANTSVQWADPSDAFLILQTQFMEGVDIDENGKVIGMDAAVKEMAKKKAHLVKKTPTDASEANGSVQNGQRKGANGQPSGLKESGRFPMVYH